MRNYKKYDVWIKSHELVLIVFKEVAPLFPKSQQFELSSQMKRAAYSIPLNIVEGCGRNTDKDFCHFLDIALGSAQELEYCFILGKDLEYMSTTLHLTLENKIGEIKAKLINLIKSIRPGVTNQP